MYCFAFWFAQNSFLYMICHSQPVDQPHLRLVPHCPSSNKLHICLVNITPSTITKAEWLGSTRQTYLTFAKWLLFSKGFCFFWHSFCFLAFKTLWILQQRIILHYKWPQNPIKHYSTESSSELNLWNKLAATKNTDRVKCRAHCRLKSYKSAI